MKRLLHLGALALTATLAAVAQMTPASHIYRSGNEWIEESSGALSAAQTIRVKSNAGSIRVQGGAQENVTYIARKHVCAKIAGSESLARREFSRMRIVNYVSGDVVWIRGESEGGGCRGAIDFELVVPKSSALVRLETGAGSVAANNISGKVEIFTGAGSVRLDQVGGSASISSGGGSVDIGKAGGDLRITTGGGNIQIDSAAGEVFANTGGGGVTVGTGKGMVLQTGGGNIVIKGECNGRLQATTGGGNIKIFQVDGGALLRTGGGGINTGRIQGGVRAETGAGAIVAELGAGGTPFTDSRLETPVGDIIVYVPDNLGVTIRATVQLSHGDGIYSDFSQIKITRSADTYGPREAYAEGSLNGGGPVLHVHTNTGSIEFRRKK
ncbi:MAG TPA: hypothetical protein VEW69_06845 [Alphaproteobacteria bacterium]|nr:hypothetical protein [Alphaproteobacteria bacterium]